jgi:hypothetical protein
VVDPEYARLNIGVSITRGNSGNGALPTRVLEQAENKREVGQVTGPRASPPLSRNDRSVTIDLRPTLSNLIQEGSTVNDTVIGSVLAVRCSRASSR